MKTVKWRIVIVIAFAAAATLAAALLGVDGLRILAPRVSQAAAPPARALSLRECDDLCREAFVPLDGVTRKTSDADLHKLLLSRFGEFSGKELFDAYRDARLMVSDGKLFFPTGELCRQQNLRGECAALCAELMRTR